LTNNNKQQQTTTNNKQQQTTYSIVHSGSGGVLHTGEESNHVLHLHSIIVAQVVLNGVQLDSTLLAHTTHQTVSLLLIHLLVEPDLQLIVEVLLSIGLNESPDVLDLHVI
jgi:hypothetical protein